MSQHKQYMEYKMVKAGWLKSLPEHWGLLPLKAIASVELSNVDKKSADGEPEVHLCNYVDVYKNEKITRKITFMQATATAQQIQRLSLEEGDVLLTKDSESPNDIGVPSLVAEPVKAVCGYHLALARPNPNFCDGGFLAWFIRSQPNKAYFETEAKGLTRYGIDKSSIKDTPVAYPPLLEQQQIKSFLDRETGRIDTLIAKKTRFIELLKEKRQAVITQAVTKGFDDTVPMKDSGVKWLGMVPEHWLVCKSGYYLSILTGFPFPSGGFSSDESDIKLLRGINVGVSILKWAETVFWRRTENDGLDSYALNEGDLVMGMDRPLISEGVRVAKVQKSDLPCLLLQRVALLKTRNRLSSDYFYRLLSSEIFVAHFHPETTGISVPHISPEQISNFIIPIPPIYEQERISAFITAEIERIERLLEKTQRSIELLKEHRTALITAAVTGKIDVREAA